MMSHYDKTPNLPTHHCEIPDHVSFRDLPISEMTIIKCSHYLKKLKIITQVKNTNTFLFTCQRQLLRYVFTDITSGHTSFPFPNNYCHVKGGRYCAVVPGCQSTSGFTFSHRWRRIGFYCFIANYFYMIKVCTCFEGRHLSTFSQKNQLEESISTQLRPKDIYCKQ